MGGMARVKISGVVLCALVLSVGAARAQSMFQLRLRGTSYSTNAAGRFVATPFSDKTILQDVAASAGNVDARALTLVYRISANSFGDAIEAVNSTNGAVLATVFGFYYGDSLGRVALTNALETEVRRVDYIYDVKQSTDALGSAFLTKRFITQPRGNVRTVIQADMQYLVRPQGDNPAQICVATFTTTKPFIPSNP